MTLELLTRPLRSHSALRLLALRLFFFLPFQIQETLSFSFASLFFPPFFPSFDSVSTPRFSSFFFSPSFLPLSFFFFFLSFSFNFQGQHGQTMPPVPV